MKNSSLLKWASNNKASKVSKDDKGKWLNEVFRAALRLFKLVVSDGKSKNWLHNPETLKNGHVAYLVKFLGSTEVDKPKGIDVVKQGIQKLKFSQQLKKSEGQSKTPKVELTISVEGVAIQEPKTKKILHQYPLHKISYCADDKAEKRFFSFISKEGDSDKHVCFVFVSDKLVSLHTHRVQKCLDWLIVVGLAGWRNNSHDRTGVWTGIQKVFGHKWKRIGDSEDHDDIAKESFHVGKRKFCVKEPTEWFGQVQRG